MLQTDSEGDIFLFIVVTSIFDKYNSPVAKITLVIHIPF